MMEQPIYSSQLSNERFLDWLLTTYPDQPSEHILLINISKQTLFHLKSRSLSNTYTISSASNGTGNRDGSGKTPLGAHAIQEKHGARTPFAGILKGRTDTGKVARIISNPNESSDADNITSRILWLKGLESGYNLGGDIDSYQRYIYIHGTDEEGRLGQPASHGCIRMANQDVIALFDQVNTGTFVYIYPQ